MLVAIYLFVGMYYQYIWIGFVYCMVHGLPSIWQFECPNNFLIVVGHVILSVKNLNFWASVVSWNIKADTQEGAGEESFDKNNGTFFLCMIGLIEWLPVFSNQITVLIHA